MSHPLDPWVEFLNLFDDDRQVLEDQTSRGVREPRSELIRVVTDAARDIDKQDSVLASRVEPLNKTFPNRVKPLVHPCRTSQVITVHEVIEILPVRWDCLQVLVHVEAGIVSCLQHRVLLIRWDLVAPALEPIVGIGEDGAEKRLAMYNHLLATNPVQLFQTASAVQRVRDGIRQSYQV